MRSSLSVSAHRHPEGTVQLAGSRAALRQLATLVRAEKPVTADLSVSPDQSSSVGWLGSLLIEPNDDDSLLVRTEGNAVIFAGNQGSRDLLAQNIEAVADDPHDPLNHLHIEYFPGHFYIRKGSTPLIVKPDK